MRQFAFPLATSRRPSQVQLLTAALLIATSFCAVLWLKSAEERRLTERWLSFPTPPNASWMRVAFTPWSVDGLGAETSVGGPLLTSQSVEQVAQWYAAQLPGWRHKTVGGVSILCQGNTFLEISTEAGGEGQSVTVGLRQYSWRFRNVWEEPADYFAERYRCS